MACKKIPAEVINIDLNKLGSSFDPGSERLDSSPSGSAEVKPDKFYFLLPSDL